jgi:hypothetical protein
MLYFEVVEERFSLSSFGQSNEIGVTQIIGGVYGERKNIATISRE